MTVHVACYYYSFDLNHLLKNLDHGKQIVPIGYRLIFKFNPDFFFVLLTGFSKALRLVCNNKTTVRRRIVWATLLFLTWLVLLGILAWNGFFLNYKVLPPRFVYVFLPPVLFIIYLAASKTNTALLLKIPTSWLISLQTFRVVVEIVLWLLFLDNVIPVQMTFEGRNFDILVGLTAPLMGYIVSRNPKNFTWAFIWNIVGLGLVLNIVIVAILSAPFPFRVFLNEPANTIISYLPYIWLPGFVVPIAIASHVLSLKQLYLKSQASKK